MGGLEVRIVGEYGVEFLVLIYLLTSPDKISMQ